MKITENILKKTILILCSLSVVCYLPEIFLYPGVVQKYFNINASFLVLFFLSIAITIRFVFRVIFDKWLFLNIILRILPALLTITLGMFLAEVFLFENITLAYLHIHPHQFANLSMHLILLVPIFAHKDAIQTYWKHFMFSFAIISFVLLVFLKWYAAEIFIYFDKEDALIEYLSFFMYAASSLVCFLSIKKTRLLNKPHKLKVFWQLLLGIGALGLFIIAGEEISWGQRILGIATPEQLQEINMQGETTIHNLEAVFEFVYYAYLVLGTYGVISPLVRKIHYPICGHSVAQWFKPVLSTWYIAPYFLPIVGYVVWRYGSHLNGTYDPWEEFSELYLSFGILVLFLVSYLTLESSQNILGKKNK